MWEEEEGRLEKRHRDRVDRLQEAGGRRLKAGGRQGMAGTGGCHKDPLLGCQWNFTGMLWGVWMCTRLTPDHQLKPGCLSPPHLHLCRTHSNDVSSGGSRCLLSSGRWQDWCHGVKECACVSMLWWCCVSVYQGQRRLRGKNTRGAQLIGGDW